MLKLSTSIIPLTPFRYRALQKPPKTLHLLFFFFSSSPTFSLSSFLFFDVLPGPSVGARLFRARHLLNDDTGAPRRVAVELHTEKNEDVCGLSYDRNNSRRSVADQSP